MRAQYETRLATLKTTNYKDGQFLIIILSKLQYKERIDDHLNLRLSEAEIYKIVCFFSNKLHECRCDKKTNRLDCGES